MFTNTIKHEIFFCQTSSTHTRVKHSFLLGGSAQSLQIC